MARELDTTLWRAWVGFNLSHALGVIVTASVVLFHALDDLDQAVHNAWYLVLTLVTPVIYLLLSIRYWFARPTRGIAVGGVLLAVGVFGARLT